MSPLDRSQAAFEDEPGFADFLLGIVAVISSGREALTAVPAEPHPAADDYADFVLGWLSLALRVERVILGLCAPAAQVPAAAPPASKLQGLLR